MSWLHSAQFLQPILESNSKRKAQMPYRRKVPTASESQLQFHVLLLLSGQVGMKNLSCIRNAMESTLAEKAVLLGRKDFGVLTKYRSSRALHILTEDYICINLDAILLQILAQRADGFVSLR